MRTVSEKLDLLSAKYGKSNTAVLHKIYKDIEEEFETVLEDERCLLCLSIVGGVGNSFINAFQLYLPCNQRKGE